MSRGILPPGKNVLVYMPHEVLEQLDQAAGFLGYARSKLIRDAVEAQLPTGIRDQVEERKKALNESYRGWHPSLIERSDE